MAPKQARLDNSVEPRMSRRKASGPDVLNATLQGFAFALTCWFILWEGRGLASTTRDRMFDLAWWNNGLLFAELLILRRSFGSVMTPAPMFALLLSLFTSGQMITYSFGIEPRDASVLNRESWTSIINGFEFYLIAFVAFCSAMIMVNEFVRPKPRRAVTEEASNAWEHGMRTVGWLCAVVGGLPFAVVTWNNLQVVVTQGYSGYYDPASRLGGPLVGLGYLFVSGVILLGLSGKRSQLKGTTITLGVVALIRLAAGDRGEGMIYLLTALLMWKVMERSEHRQRLVFVVIGFVAVLLIPTIGVVRHSLAAQGIGSLKEAFTAENPLIDTLNTIGGTLFPLVKVTELVPAGAPFAHGGSYASSVIGLIPDALLSETLREFVADSFYARPAVWLQDRLDMSYGPGYTPFAEAYLNFGFTGGIVALSIFGGLLSLWLRGYDPSRPAPHFQMALILISFALLGFSVRGSFTQMAPFTLRYVLFPALLVSLFAFRRSRELGTKRSRRHRGIGA